MSTHPPPPPPPPMPQQVGQPLGPNRTFGARFRRKAKGGKDPTHTLIMIGFLLAFGILTLQFGRLQVTVINLSPQMVDVVTLYFGEVTRHGGAIPAGERFNTSFEGGTPGTLGIRVLKEGDEAQVLTRELGEADTGFASSRAFFIVEDGTLVEGRCGLLCRFDFGEPEVP